MRVSAADANEGLTVPDWLLTVLRFLLVPVTWGRRRLRKWHADRQALVREGSEIVTRVQQYVESLGPTSLVWATKEQGASTWKTSAPFGTTTSAGHLGRT